MQIVHQSATFSYSLVPPYPLLSAPPVPLALPAPAIHGLLTAPKLTIIVEKRDWVDDLLEELGPFQTREEMDAELMEIVDRMNERVRQHRAHRAQETMQETAQ